MVELLSFFLKEKTVILTKSQAKLYNRDQKMAGDSLIEARRVWDVCFKLFELNNVKQEGMQNDRFAMKIRLAALRSVSRTGRGNPNVVI